MTEVVQGHGTYLQMKIKPVITYLRYSSKSRTNHSTMVSTHCFSKESWLTAAALSLLGQRERVKSLECGLRSLNAFISHPRVHDNFAQSTQARDAAPRTVRDDHSFFSPLFSPDGIPPSQGSCLSVPHSGDNTRTTYPKYLFLGVKTLTRPSSFGLVFRVQLDRSFLRFQPAQMPDSPSR